MLQHAADKFCGGAERTEISEFKCKKIFSEEKDGLRLGHEFVSRIQTNVDRLCAKHTVTKRMERGNPHLGRAVGERDIDTLLHFAARFFGEGERQNFFRLGTAGGNKMLDPLGDDGRLPGSRARDDKQRAVAKRYGLFLLVL